MSTTEALRNIARSLSPTLTGQIFRRARGLGWHPEAAADAAKKATEEFGVRPQFGSAINEIAQEVLRADGD